MTVKELYENFITPHVSCWFLTLKERENNIVKTIRYYVWESSIQEFFNREIENFDIYPEDGEICFLVFLKPIRKEDKNG